MKAFNILQHYKPINITNGHFIVHFIAHTLIHTTHKHNIKPLKRFEHAVLLSVPYLLHPTSQAKGLELRPTSMTHTHLK